MPDSTREHRPSTQVLVTRGDVESLTCALMIEQASGSGARLIHLERDDATGQQCARCARLQAELLEVELEVVATSPTMPRWIQELCTGLELAGPAGRLHWPQRCGPDADAVAATFEFIQHVREARALSTREPSSIVETPLIDLDPVQTLELAFDLDAPLDASWLYQPGEEAAFEASATGTEWREALSQLGREWPWGTLQPVQ